MVFGLVIDCTVSISGRRRRSKNQIPAFQLHAFRLSSRGLGKPFYRCEMRCLHPPALASGMIRGSVAAYVCDVDGDVG